MSENQELFNKKEDEVDLVAEEARVVGHLGRVARHGAQQFACLGI